jgi:Ni/Fe-hydrogenase b-type cytochrome subunit
MSGEVIEIVESGPRPRVPRAPEDGSKAEDNAPPSADEIETPAPAQMETEPETQVPKEAGGNSSGPEAATEENPEELDDEPVIIGRAVYEHPFIVRLCHWVNVVALFVMVGSGLQIFRAFPSFGAKIPQKDLLHWPKAFAIGGWLGGGLQWHLTFMWIYLGTGLVYIGYQLFSGNYKQVLFVPRDIPGVWPMVKHYFFFGPKPAVREAYNPLQKQAYTSAIGLGVLSVLTGLVVWKPIQFSWLAWLMGGFHYARIWHFAVMWAILFFVLGHLVMVVLHGWNNFMSMLTGWKKNPEYGATPEGDL